MKKSVVLSLFVVLAFTASAQVKRVEAVGIVVSDLDRAVAFYSEVLQFRKLAESDAKGAEWEKLYGVFGLHQRTARMQLGDEIIELIDYLTPGGRSIPENARSNDLAFQHIAIVVSDMDSAYAVLRRHNVVRVSTAPQTLPPTIPAAAGIKAFYFQDPDQHNLELIFFPKGKGQEKWQRADGRLFLGIDHTAIGVGNTGRSHGFYQAMLGFARKGDSWNKGDEQAHLNNVQGASLHITGYRSPEGPGVEFLQYLLPGPGRKYPADTRADDLWSWFTLVAVDDVETLYARLKKAGCHFVSKGLVGFSQYGVQQRGFVVRDPDGHAVLVTGE